MTAQHKTEKAARLAGYAAKLAAWQALDARSELGSATQLARICYQNATPTAAPIVVQETRN